MEQRIACSNLLPAVNDEVRLVLSTLLGVAGLIHPFIAIKNKTYCSLQDCVRELVIRWDDRTSKHLRPTFVENSSVAVASKEASLVKRGASGFIALRTLYSPFRVDIFLLMYTIPSACLVVSHSSKVAVSPSRMATPARDVIDLTAETPPAASNNNNNSNVDDNDDDNDEVVVIENEDEEEDDDTQWHFLLEMSAASYRYVRIVGTATRDLKSGSASPSTHLLLLTYALLFSCICIQQGSGTTEGSHIPGST
jgi:hypothetical protein